MAEESTPFAGWAILELMGHRRLGGHVEEVQLAGAGFLRIDVPAVGDLPAATQLYSPGAVYCLTPTTEAMARAAAGRGSVRPVERWELAALERGDEVVPAELVEDEDEEPRTCPECGGGLDGPDDVCSSCLDTPPKPKVGDLLGALEESIAAAKVSASRCPYCGGEHRSASCPAELEPF